MIVLAERDVSSVLSMRDAIDAVESALRAQADEKVHQPLRIATRTPHGLTAAMPGAIFSASGAVAAKLVSFYPGNAARGLHTHTAVIVVFDSETGVPIALVDGRYITEIRTGAISAVATRAVAVADAGVVAVLGTGVQARSHVEALHSIGMLKELRVWGRTREKAEAVVAWAAAMGIRAKSATTVSDACRGADIVCTVTSALSSFVKSSDIAGGCHINAVGACTPTMQELGADLVARARLIVDTAEGARTEAGDIIVAIREGALPAEPEMIRLCDVIAGKVTGRRSRDEVTIFKSVGMAIEDVACAALAVERARQRGLGATVEI